MTDPRIIWALLIAAQLVVNIPFLIHLLAQWRKLMALDFSKLQAAAGDIAADASALQAVPAPDSAADQTAIDAVTSTLTSAHATLQSLLPAPPTPAADATQ